MFNNPLAIDMNRVVVCLLILCILISPASAGLTDSAAEAVSKGLENFFNSASDAIFDMSFSGYDDAAGNGTIGYIYNVASYTPNPSDYPLTNKFRTFSEIVYAAGYPVLLLAAFIILLVTHYRADFIQKLAQITGINIASKSNILAKKALDGIIIAVFMYVGIYFILLLNDALTKAVMLETLDSITPIYSNFILYFMMAIAYLIMGFFFSARILIIFLFYSFALLIGFCLLIDHTKSAACGLCAYFVQTVFFQFIIVLYFSASIMIIQTIVDPLNPSGQMVMYTVMLIGGVLLAIKLMLGTGVIKRVGKTAALLV